MPEPYIFCTISDAPNGRKRGEHIVTTEKDWKPYGIAGNDQAKLLSCRGCFALLAIPFQRLSSSPWLRLYVDDI